jgi:kynurenine formamidase
MVEGQGERISGVSDSFAMGTHTGTHMDSLVHVAYDGRLFDGTSVTSPGVQDIARGIHMEHAEATKPIIAPGVLLDFATLLGVDVVPGEYAITPGAIEECAAKFGVSFKAGDVVLLRTGRDTYWHQASRFLEAPIPGVTAEAARMLVSRGVVATGADTMPYEQSPAPVALEVHVELLTKAGVFIFECLDLRELARRRMYRFLFAALPLRLPGATGSPVNPAAIVFPEFGA